MIGGNGFHTTPGDVPRTVAERLSALMAGLQAMPGVVVAGVISRGGTVLAGTSLPGFHMESFSAMCAAMSGAATAAAGEAIEIEIGRITAEYPQGAIVIRGLGPRSLLAVLVKGRENARPVEAETDRVTGELQKILDEKP